MDTKPKTAGPVDRQPTFRDSVCSATASFLLENGVQAVKSAEIAREFGTTESRMFRHFDGMRDVMHATFEWSWQQVVDAVTAGSFTSVEFEPLTTIAVDLQSILEMRNSDESFKAAVVAFTYYRRPEELAACGNLEVRSQDRYVSRLRAQCRAYLRTYADDLLVRCPSADEALATRLMNYLATAFLSWFLLPRDSTDPLDPIHELSVDEVLLGANQLIGRFVECAQPSGGDSHPPAPSIG